MDKELAQLEEWAVDLINNYEDSLRKAGVKPSGPGGSQFKRAGRFSGELVANPEAYGELLEMARSKNMSGKELVDAIRRIEQSLLDETSRGTKTSRKLLMSDVIHHMYAQRTGGDTLRRLAQAERGKAREILRDSFGRWGNVPENLLSIYRAWHQDTDPLKGVEAAAMESKGITKAGQLSTSKFHKTRSASPLISGTVQATTAEEAVEGMTPMFERQREEGLAALGELQILRNQLSERLGLEIIDPRTLSTAELAAVRNIYDANSELVERTIRENLSNYIIDGGSIRSAIGSVAQAENFLRALRDNLPGESAGALFGLLLDPQMREAVEKGDSSKVGNILATDVGLGGLANIVSDKVMKILPPDVVAKVAPALKTGATAMNVAAPVAAVSQIEGSTDPMVTQRKAVERLEQGSEADIKRKQYLPQAYGAAGPQMDPTTGQVITEPEPLITPEKIKEGGKMLMQTIGGAMRLMPSGLGF